MVTATINNVYSDDDGPILKIDREFVANEAADPTLPMVNFNNIAITDSISDNGQGGAFWLDLDTIMSTMTTMSFTNIESRQDGGVIYLHTATSLIMSGISAYNFKTTHGEGSFIHLDTASNTNPFTLSLTLGSFSC